jgi:transcriptional regulator with GAF, ATPase, and Fis domain
MNYTSNLILSNSRIIADLSHEVERLEKENKRFKEALKKIIAPCDGMIGCSCLSGADCAKIAKEALEG